jgi:branched-chain amino acid transport system permease protein
MYISQAIHGISYGMILFLLASGLNVIFGMMGILNLAHGAFFMLGAYICYQLTVWIGNFWVALVLGPVLTAGLGMLVQIFLMRPVMRKTSGAITEMNLLVLTQGLVFAIIGLIKIFWGSDTIALPVPDALSGLVPLGGGLEYPLYRLFIICLGCVVMAIMVLLLYRSRLGKIVRAAVEDRGMVSALGINVSLVLLLVFGVGIWMAGLAGFVIAPILTVSPGLGDLVGPDAFLVVITAGFGSLLGGFFVAIIFGLLSSFGVQLFSSLAPVIIVVFMAIVLLIRPNGLFKAKE